MRVQLVSVIIPVYNGERYIAQAIDSVLAQTVSDYEIIVIDDGSTDGIRTIIEQYHDPRIRYCYQPNGGAAHARNTGLQRASGEYIAFLDADDIWEPAKLEEQLNFFELHPEISVCACEFQYIDGEGRVTGGSEMRRLYPRDGLCFYDFLRCCFLLPSSVLMASGVIGEAGGFDPRFDRAEDTEFFLRVLEKYHLGIVKKNLLKYRRQDQSFSAGTACYEARERALDEFFKRRLFGASRELKMAVRGAYYQLYFCHGQTLLWYGRNREARTYFKKAFKVRPSLKTVFFYLKSFAKDFLMALNLVQRR